MQAHGSQLDELVALRQLSSATTLFTGEGYVDSAALQKVLETVQKVLEASSARHLDAEAAFLQLKWLFSDPEAAALGNSEVLPAHVAQRMFWNFACAGSYAKFDGLYHSLECSCKG